MEMNWEREKGFYEISKKERAMTKIELENCSIDTDQVINFPIIIKNNFYKPITHSTYRFITSYTYRMNQESLFDPSLGLYTSFWMSNLYLHRTFIIIKHSIDHLQVYLYSYHCFWSWLLLWKIKLAYQILKQVLREGKGTQRAPAVTDILK